MKLSNLLINLLYLAFFPMAFIGLLAVSLISGVGGTFHIIVYDLYPTFKRFWASLRQQTVASESQKLIK
tara:strand:+ start:391 stop:597 length:207 start_codon:yes stop_codon:yes gene_type:complete